MKADMPASNEPSGLLRTDGKRPDGVTLLPWKSGRHLTWDVTVIDTVAASYINSTSSIIAGGAAELASSRKQGKYNLLAKTYDFCAVAFESLGPINEDGLNLLKELGRRLTIVSGDTREFPFLLQRISIAIQRCNAVSFRGSFPSLESNDTA